MDAYANNLAATFATTLADAIAEATEGTAGQSGALAAALTYLLQEPDIGVEPLRAALGLSQPATVRLANQLVESGHATRATHESDGRRVRLRLTDKGRKAARNVLRARAAAVEGALYGLTARERDQLVRLLSKAFASIAPSQTLAEHICRLCDTTVCPVVKCPVNLAIVQPAPIN